MKPLSEQSLYEILEIPRSATPLQVQRAYERARAIFGPGSLASYTLLTPDEAEALSIRIEEARSVLLDPRARATYDERLPVARAPVAPGVPRLEISRPAAAAMDVQPPEGTPWTGDLIRRAREARGLTIPEVSVRTKVQRSHIENVEAERFELFPPPAYLRGILISIASALHVDGERLARSYMERAARSPGKER